MLAGCTRSTPRPPSSQAGLVPLKSLVETAPPHLALARGGSLSNVFQTRTRRIAHQLAEGAQIPRGVLDKVLRHRKLSPDQVAVWVDVLHRRDPIYALGQLGLLESAAHPDTPDRPDCPDWLYLALPAMVSRHEHAPYLASQLVSDRFARLGERERAVFVARCVQHFLKVRHYVALRETVELVAFSRDDGPVVSTEHSFGQILSALASERQRANRISSAPTDLVHALRDQVVETMRTRRVARTESLATWLPLFSPALVPTDPDEAIALVAEMTEAGWTPKRKVLHQVFKAVVRGQHGARDATSRHAAAQIRDELERLTARRRSRQGLKTCLRVTRVDEVPLRLPVHQVQGNVNRPGACDEVPEEEDDKDVLHKGHEIAEPVRIIEPDPPAGASRAQGATRPDSETQTHHPPAKASPRGPASPLKASRPRDEIYSTTALYDSSNALAYFAELRKYVSDSGRGASFPAPPFPSSPVAWSALFRSIRDEYSISANLIVAVVRKLELASSAPSSTSGPYQRSYTPPAPTVRVYTTVMRCLVARRAYSHVVSVFQKLAAKGFAIDATILDLHVRALCALGREREAIRLVRFYEYLPGVHDRSNLVSLRTPAPSTTSGRQRQQQPQQHSVRLDVVPFNALLSHYNHSGEYGRVYGLFKDLEPKHAVRPDVATLTILVDAARHASIDAGRGWDLGLDELGQVDDDDHLVGTGRSRNRGVVGAGGGGHVGLGLDQRVSRAGRRRRSGGGGGGRGGAVVSVDDKWDRVPAARRLETLVWEEIIDANWQGVELVNPLEPKRLNVNRWWWTRSSSSPSSSSSSSSLRPPQQGSGPSSSSFADRTERPANWRPFASTLAPRPPAFPDVYPSDPFVRSVVLLTGVHSHVERIGLVLAWARHAGVAVSRLTLLLALAYVEGDAAIKRDRVERLRAWLADWVGLDNVPGQDEIAWLRRGGTVSGKPELR